MIVSTKSVANAVSGKTARACDSCVKKRARWYCVADDAFLCESCDSTVHSANPLARRHERVRLKTASSFKLLSAPTSTWHKGFTRKARTTRRSPKGWKWKANPVPFVPEVGADEISQHDQEDQNDDEEQLLYRVPIFDPFVAELCGGGATSNEKSEFAEYVTHDDHPENTASSAFGSKQECDSKLRGFFPSDLDLAEFAADVESMLGKGLEDQSFAMEDLGLAADDVKLGSVKVESEESCRESRGGGDVDERMEVEVDGRETFELNFEYDSPEGSCGGAEEDVKDELDHEKLESGVLGGAGVEEEENINGGKKKVLLSLDYEAVIGEWASRGPPWTTAHRPQIDPDQCLPDLWAVGGKGVCGLAYGELTGLGMGSVMGDGGREARVSRYREKRRTRLFSKKIRYEVRKLNAEKRPRMKGRFVKRVSFAPPPNTFAMPSSK